MANVALGGRQIERWLEHRTVEHVTVRDDELELELDDGSVVRLTARLAEPQAHGATELRVERH